MKKNDWLLFISIALYSFLFYEQTAGINFMLFSIVLIAALYIKDNALLKSKSWLLVAAGSLLSGICVAIYGNELSIIANIISLSILAGICYKNKSSVILSLLFSFYSYITTPIFIFIDWTERKKNNISTPNKFSRKVILIIAPIIITLVFFLIYRESNPLFRALADKINLDFISWSWIIFTFGGFLLLYGFFYHKRITSIAHLDDDASNILTIDKRDTAFILGKGININEENFSGIVLFSLLNILLLIVNSLDINFLFIDRRLPLNITYSQFVHQGIGALIVSVIIAIIIILFYFRGALNFYEKSKAIKLLAYCWIIQNAFMLISTMSKNSLYVNVYGLTYKRIGVYIYLLLTLIGLTTTFIKILKFKTNIYLFRINGWLFYAVLVISSFINWDAIITNFNITSAQYTQRNYLLELSDTNLPQLFVIENKALKTNSDDDVDPLSYDINNKTATTNFEEQLNRKLYFYLQNHNNLDWKDWYYDDSRVFNQLKKANTFDQITTLNLTNTEINNTYLLNCFPSLQKLSLQNCSLANINFLKKYPNLEYLNLKYNSITDYTPLYTLRNLKELYISSIDSKQLDVLQKYLPQTKIITQDELNNSK